MNAQYAEESYQLKRENSTLKRQLEEKENPNIDQTLKTINNKHNTSDLNAVYEELEMLREIVNRLSDVGVFICLC